MADYPAIARSSTNGIRKNGVTATLTRLVDGSFDPITGEDSTASTESQQVSVVLLPASSSKKDGLDKIFASQGEAKRKSTHYALMAPLLVSDAALTFEPDAGQTLLVNSVTWFVNGSTVTSPAGEAVLYELALRL